MFTAPNHQNKPIKLTKRAGIPADVLPAPGLTRKQLEQPAQIKKNDCANTYRPRKETAEERRLRKQAIKEERRVSCTKLFLFAVSYTRNSVLCVFVSDVLGLYYMLTR